MSALPRHNEPDGVDPLIRAETEQIITAPGYSEDVREFRAAVKDGTAYEGALASREEIERQLGLRP